jgi:hypothetical protein
MFRGESGIACRSLLVGSVEEFVTPERSESCEAVARDSVRRIISCAGIADDGLIQIPDLIKTAVLNNGSRLVATNITVMPISAFFLAMDFGPSTRNHESAKRALRRF